MTLIINSLQVVQNQHQQVSAPLLVPAFNHHHYKCPAQQCSMVQSQNVHPIKLREQQQHSASESGQDNKITPASSQHFSHQRSEQTLFLKELQGTHEEPSELGVSQFARPKVLNIHEQQVIPSILLHNERQQSTEASFQHRREKSGDQEQQAKGHPRKIDDQHVVTYNLEQASQKTLKQPKKKTLWSPISLNISEDFSAVLTRLD
eukprot:TRINITY_DN13318_c0_g1_i3.p1 TRINITY_DN13318_c0_g1~~TRINITY_DN13318_c0_g1_i3.p1  ORF type:complete len:205 (+),score=31.68 TRINITY_DN13318_c0_g1_i3:432-1046(+)